MHALWSPRLQRDRCIIPSQTLVSGATCTGLNNMQHVCLGSVGITAQSSDRQERHVIVSKYTYCIHDGIGSSTVA